MWRPFSKSLRMCLLKTLKLMIPAFAHESDVRRIKFTSNISTFHASDPDGISLGWIQLERKLYNSEERRISNPMIVRNRNLISQKSPTIGNQYSSSSVHGLHSLSTTFSGFLVTPQSALSISGNNIFLLRISTMRDTEYYARYQAQHSEVAF